MLVLPRGNVFVFKTDVDASDAPEYIYSAPDTDVFSGQSEPDQGNLSSEEGNNPQGESTDSKLPQRVQTPPSATAPDAPALPGMCRILSTIVTSKILHLELKFDCFICAGMEAYRFPGTRTAHWQPDNNWDPYREDLSVHCILDVQTQQL
jgi:hypothetical protein